MVYKFDCGCQLPILNAEEKQSDGLPSLYIPYDEMMRELNYSKGCPATWELLSTGHTKGIFQLETNLGQNWSEKLQPSSIEEMAALISIIRPGCISKDTKILIRYYRDGKSNGGNYVKVSMEKLYEQFNQKHHAYNADIISLDETTNCLVQNKITDVTYSGKKDVYKLLLRTRKRITQGNGNSFDVKATLDHKFLTHDRGWVELIDIQIGERIAVKRNTKEKSRNTKNALGEKNFRDICYTYYKYKCIFCDWKEASLDVNHLEGNRKTNNNPNNLCFMCPNHHRMYSEGLISKEQCINAREEHKINVSEDIMWAKYEGRVFVENTDTYDISVDGPNHNFIAGNVVVHNCLRAIVDGKSLTKHYCDRKGGQDEVTYFHSALAPILEATQGILVFQEQAIRIATNIAGFNEQEADTLRKAIGKKKADIMAEVKKAFLEGCKTVGMVTEEEGEEIFSWIQESQRYSFNKSHGVGYGYLGYMSAWVKQHFPMHFYCSWISHAREKQKTQVEVKELISDAKLFDIEVRAPSLSTLWRNDSDVCIYNGGVNFGVKCIKKVGDAVVNKLIEKVREKEVEVGKPIQNWTWLEFLAHVSTNVTSTCINGLISVGTLDCYRISRTRMLYEYEMFKKLSKRERDAAIEILHKHESLDTLIQEIKTLTKLTRTGKTTNLLSAKRRDMMDSLVDAVQNPPKSLDDKPGWVLTQERNLLGTPLSYHIIDTIDSSIVPNTTCKEFRLGKNGDCIIAVEIISVRPYTITRGQSQGNKMGFITAEDSTGQIDCVAFTNVWEKHEMDLQPANTVALMGKRSDKGSFQIEKVYNI